MTKLIRTVWVLCLSLQLCLPADEGGRELVLCRGENGHIAIEAAASGCCVELSISDLVAGDRLTSTGNEAPPRDHCGECLDIPISTGLATIPKDRGSVGPAAPTPACGAGVVSQQPEFSGFQPLPRPSVLPGYPPPLRSIILLI